MSKARREQLEEMLRETPDDPELHYMLAMEFASEGDDEGAVRGFAEIIRRAPRYAPAYHQGGRALVRLGRIDQARDLLRQGIPVAEQQGNAHAAGEMAELLASLDE